MADRTCRCGASIPYTGRGRPRTSCDQCRTIPAAIRPRRASHPPARHAAPNAEARLAEDHISLVRYVAQQMARTHPHVSAGDLMVDGYVGLAEAARKFDPARGLQFNTYAIPVIRGRILDGLRGLDPLTRDDRKSERKIIRGYYRYAAREGRFPTSRELASELGWTEQAMIDARQRINRTFFWSLEDPVSKNPDETPDVRGDLIADEGVNLERDMCLEDARADMRALIRQLNTREQFVLHAYYWEQSTLREIGDVLCVTESRVSQIHTRALEKLRAMAPADLMEAA